MYQVLIDYAEKFGRPHPDGVIVSLDVRTLCEEARIGNEARSRADTALQEAGLVARPPHTGARNEAHSFVLRRGEGVYNSNHSPEAQGAPGGGSMEWDWLYTHPVFAYGRLNASGAVIVIALLTCGGCAMKRDVKALTHKDTTALRTPLARLELHGIVRIDGQQITLVEDWRERIDEVAEAVFGASIAATAKRARHEEERRAYRERTLHYHRLRGLPELPELLEAPWHRTRAGVRPVPKRDATARVQSAQEGHEPSATKAFIDEPAGLSAPVGRRPTDPLPSPSHRRG